MITGKAAQTRRSSNPSAGLCKFTIEQSIGYKTVFQWTDDDDNPIDITGLEPVMQIRTSQSKSSKLLADLAEHLTVVNEQGRVMLSVPDAASYEYYFGTGYYSLRLGNSSCLIEGTVTLSRVTPRVRKTTVTQPVTNKVIVDESADITVVTVILVGPQGPPWKGPG